MFLTSCNIFAWASLFALKVRMWASRRAWRTCGDVLPWASNEITSLDCGRIGSGEFRRGTRLIEIYSFRHLVDLRGVCIR